MNSSSSLVLELQRLATDKTNDITDLLRKALLVASKLKVEDFKQWIENELHGYESRPVPDYRTARAQLKAINPYRGYIPFVIGDQELAEKLTRVEIRQGIGTLVALLDKGDADDGHLTIPFTDQQKLHLTAGQDVFLEPTRIIGTHCLASIIDSVRTMVLQWSIRLEDAGIVGEDMGFSPQEKQEAASNANIRIENFQGVLGDVYDSTVSQNLKMTVNCGDFDSLSRFLQSQGLQESEINELREAVESDPKPTEKGSFGSCVGEWLGKMVSKAAQGLSQIPVSAASGLLADAVSDYYGL